MGLCELTLWPMFSYQVALDALMRNSSHAGIT